MNKKHAIKFLILTISFCYCNVPSLAQKTIFKNNGVLKILDHTILSSYSDFENGALGKLINDGQLYYFGDFSNEGSFNYSKKSQESKVLFIQNRPTNKTIKGNNLVTFNNVVFDNKQYDSYFDLKANIDIWGEINLNSGIVKVDSTYNSATHLSMGMVSFMPKSGHKNANSQSFIDGYVEKVGNDDFVFPIGNKSHYRPAIISASKGIKDIISSKYIYNDKAFFNSNKTHSLAIDKLNTKEYWLLEKSIYNTSDIILTLSWDEATTPKELLINPEKYLHIVYWDDMTKKWEDMAGIVDLENKTITTPTSLKQYGYFTLATFRQNISDSDQVIIYNLVTPNNDDLNDYFLIENINKYPDNNLQVFNRWGEKVYQTTNYDSNGNVFNGYPNSGSTLSKTKLLPSGTYYYFLTYQVKNHKSSYTIKKSGFIHLETH